MRIGQEIDEAPGRGDEDIGALLDHLALGAETDAAVDDADVEIGKAGVIAKGGLDLGGEFAGGLEDQGADARLVFPVEGEDRQGKGSRLAGAGLRGGDEIATGKDDGNCAELDGGWVHVPHGLDTAENLIREAKIAKRH